MEENTLGSSPNKDLDVKQEFIESVKSEYDSGSQDSSKSGGNTSYQKWAPNLDGVRKSAFLPYRPVHCTALTNFQRGNTQAKTPEVQQQDASFHSKAGRGETTEDDILVEKNPDIRDNHGLTGLHWSTAYGQYAATSNFIRCGANVNCLGQEGETPLHFAAAGGHHDVVKLLLSSGAEVDLVDNVGNTALMFAAAGDYPYTCFELLVRGADLTLTNESNQDAYSLTVLNNSKMARTVIENFLISNLVKM